jgi:hypothetical protein
MAKASIQDSMAVPASSTCSQRLGLVEVGAQLTDARVALF